MRASADSPGPYSSSSSPSSASCSSSARCPDATTAGGVSGRGGKGARGRLSAPPPLAASAASSRARRLSGSRAQLVPAWRSMLYASPAGHGSPGATWRHSRHSHIQSSTPSPLARLPLGSTTPLPSASVCASGTPRPASCPPEATTSDGFSLAPSALGATAASACAISLPASAPLPGPSGAAPSLPAAVRRYASRACASSSLMSRGPGHCRLLRRIPRLFPRRRPPHGGCALHPTRRGWTTTRHHRLRPRRHHGRGPARHGWIRHRDRPRWRPRRGMPRMGHRQGWRSRRCPHSPRLARGYATCLPLRHPQLLGAPPRRRHRYRYRHRHRVLRRPWVLLGQGMRVLHMLVRTVMVMVLV